MRNSYLRHTDALHGRFEYLKEEGHAAPMVHVHCFSKADDPVADAVQVSSKRQRLMWYASKSAWPQ